MSSGWNIAPGRISSGWLLTNAGCHPDDIANVIPKSSGCLSYYQYFSRMTYGRCIMSSGWHTLPFLSHPDEIASLCLPIIGHVRGIELSARDVANGVFNCISLDEHKCTSVWISLKFVPMGPIESESTLVHVMPYCPLPISQYSIRSGPKYCVARYNEPNVYSI